MILNTISILIPCDCLCHKPGNSTMHFAPCCDEKGLMVKFLSIQQVQELYNSVQGKEEEIGRLRGLIEKGAKDYNELYDQAQTWKEEAGL